MIEQTRHPIDVIATQTGFADRERMRRAFLRAWTLGAVTAAGMLLVGLLANYTRVKYANAAGQNDTLGKNVID